MFFKPKKKKLDPKVRFQHQTFTQKVRAAQGYKRQAQRVPETEQEKVLASLGLDSWWSRIAVGFGVALLVYGVYIPSFLSIKTIRISGAEDDLKNGLVQTVQQYFKDAPLYAAQRNAIFLNTDKLRNYILTHNKNVWRVHDIKKDIGTVDLQVSFKRERFLLVAPSGEFVLYNDGTVVGPHDSTNQTPLVRITTQAGEVIRPTQQYLSEQMLTAIELIQDNLERTATLPVDYYELPVAVRAAQETTEDADLGALSILVPNELVVHIKASETQKHVLPFKVYFDASSDINKAVQNLGALITHMNPAQVSSLYYIDMRFPERGFSCAKQTPCSVETPVVPVEESQSSVEDSTEAALVE